MLCEFYNYETKIRTIETDFKEALKQIEKARLLARKEMIKTDKTHVLFAIKFYSEDGRLEKISIYKNTCLSDEELDELIKTYPYCSFCVLHSGTCKDACADLVEREQSREIRTITLKEANAFINKHHRHHNGTVGCKFAIGLFERNKLIGTAICGRPVSRHLDNGNICEINRLCTLGNQNACSQLYGACARIAKEMGYEKIITYILKSECGTSLKASNFICEGEAGGTHWTGERNKGQNIPHELKTRWARMLV